MAAVAIPVGPGGHQSNAVAIGAHLIGEVALLLQNKSRVVGHSGIGSTSVVKTGLTVGALTPAWSAELSEGGPVVVIEFVTAALAT